MLNLRALFLRWLINQLSSVGSAEPVESMEASAPRASGQYAMDSEGNQHFTDRQSNLFSRPGQAMASIIQDGVRYALGDGKRFNAPVEPSGGSMAVPKRYYPLPPPTPPVAERAHTFYHPTLRQFRVWGDPKQRHLWRWGGENHTQPLLTYLHEQLGVTRDLEYAGGLINGVREYYGVALPWVSRALNPSELGAISPNHYLNLLTESQGGIPLPITNGYVLCHSRAVSPDMSGTITTGDASWSAARTRDGDSDALTVLNFGIPFHTRLLQVVTDEATNPIAQIRVKLLWRASTGEISVNYLAFARQSENDLRQPSGTVGFATEDNAIESMRYGLFEGNFGEISWTAVFDRPATATWGTVSSEYDEDEDAWFGYRHFSGVFGNIITNADYEAATGQTLWNTASGEDAVGGAFFVERGLAGLAFRAFDPRHETTDRREKQLRALAENVPIMYDGPLGTIPRPYATHDGTFCGISYSVSGVEGEERVVSCDALIDDGRTFGLVCEQDRDGGNQVFTVSIDNEPVWTGVLADAVPPESRDTFYSFRMAWPNLRFQFPGWPHKMAAVGLVSIASELSKSTGPSSHTFFRPRLPHETWSKAPVVAVR